MAPEELETEDAEAVRVPHEPLLRLFLRFLRFGLLAWGGPVAQIAMVRQELVEEERWVSRAHFNRALALYQVLPGPEAHELCVYFGMLSRGRVGGLLAGLGFMLPGFLLMLLLSWLYVRAGLESAWVKAAFACVAAAVAALIVRAVHRIGQHAVTSRPLFVLALVAFAGQLAGLPFLLTLGWAGAAAAALMASGRRGTLTLVTLGAAVAGAAWLLWEGGVRVPQESVHAAAASAPSAWRLLGSGLRTGLLTFGGAYTAIPFLRRDAVVTGGWMTDAQFLDGIALGGVLPAPLIIFGTFVGYVSGGLWGALAITAGIFAPAFGVTLLAHDAMERLLHRAGARHFLDGVTAGVVGLIAATALLLLPGTLQSPLTVGVFVLALAALFLLKHKLAPLAVLGCAALVGLAAHALGTG
ncbi:chromate efflux transporter [Aggregicoccus sp. 17bor-14]|uniref:chromate efflux transporter n=1 Tax=Myxococcaceae TaxID=31 RepID=UPI00129C59DD|nr:MULTISPECIES: chromate efflux transporter [Myxococcaceae]MBF5046421.1 chromate efflux transporter [Simulacricoccus sp. 17bor-14]MRI92140.1 chromate efflux transporter [Aggregicoccus sp. 17bor-14]